MTVDFHAHSTASDGTDAPGDLLGAAAARGFAALAVTDHDNTDAFGDGPGLLRADGAPGGVMLVPGIELSIEPGRGFDKFHLLGLGIDPANAELKAFLRRVLEGRNARNERIIGNFARIGIDIAPGDLARYAHGEVLARPHFAAYLARRGFAPDVKTAFERYLLPDSPAGTRCYEERWHPPQEEAFGVIHRAGGLCVMAHPKYWRRSWKVEGPDYASAERELARLKEAGLDGLEALYQANSVEENVRFTRIADGLGLIKSAGSDYHGANKPTISLGMTVEQSFIGPLLERLAGRGTERTDK